MYTGKYQFQNIKNEKFHEIEEAIFSEFKFRELNKEIKEIDSIAWLKTKELIEVNHPFVEKHVKEFNLWFSDADIFQKSNFSEKMLGINTQNIENIAFACKSKEIEKEIPVKHKGFKNNNKFNIKIPASTPSIEKIHMVFTNFNSLNEGKDHQIEKNRILFLKESCKNGDKIESLAKYYGYSEIYIKSLVYKEKELGIDINI